MLTKEDNRSLRQAVERLEFPSLSDKLNAALGKPMEKAIALLPAKVQTKLTQAVDAAIRKSFDWVILTMDPSKETTKSFDKTHKALAASAGFAGGFFGGWGLIAEIPITTGLMLRTIADIARSHGEDLSDISTRIACVQVFALDTTRSDANHAGIGAYFAVRKTMATLVADAVTHVTGSVGSKATAQLAARTTTQAAAETAAAVVSAAGAQDAVPAMLKLMNAIANRYSIVVTEETALQWMPVIGGLGGAAITYVFTNHFQAIAHGHFTVRRLERTYGSADVQTAYETIRQDMLQQRGRARALLPR